MSRYMLAKLGLLIGLILIINRPDRTHVGTYFHLGNNRCFVDDPQMRAWLFYVNQIKRQAMEASDWLSLKKWAGLQFARSIDGWQTLRRVSSES